MGNEKVSETAKKEVSDDGSSNVDTKDLESNCQDSLEKEIGCASCRVCQCIESDKRGDAVLELLGITPVIEAYKNKRKVSPGDEENSENVSIKRNFGSNSGTMELVRPDGEFFIYDTDLETDLSHHDTLVELGCCCKNDLSLVHYACALKWFVNHGSIICEICGHLASNIRISDFSKVVSSLKEYEAFRERTARRESHPAQVHADTDVDPDALAAIRSDQLSEIALWFCPLNHSNIHSDNNVDTVIQVFPEQLLNNFTEDATLAQNPAIKWAMEATGILLASGLLTISLAWLIAPRVGKKTARNDLYILLGGICALTVVVFFRFFIMTRIRYGPARYWAILFVFWFLVFGIWASRTHSAHAA